MGTVDFMRECVYCSGPLFCPEEVAAMTAIAESLEAGGFATFLPHRDGIEAHVIPYASGLGGLLPAPLRRRIDRAIFALDVFQIVERCDYLVFNMNGRAPDEGAAVEAGIAFACGKPVVVFKSDVRSAFGGADNSMIVGLSPVPPVDEVRKLPRAILAVASARRPSPEIAALPPNVAHVVASGRRIARLLARLPAPAPLPNAELVERIVRLCEEDGISDPTAQS
ncbi:MAG: nucleoside 2-deoxyribosyltransferase [Candidatus Schekmanbacteria bacterium]|nr:nucleoside 2-deoxyribosyltransferase [Candidatus Schekmanbacteria bacterium]